jgi:hypothetical protein
LEEEMRLNRRLSFAAEIEIEIQIDVKNED